MIEGIEHFTLIPIKVPDPLARINKKRWASADSFLRIERTYSSMPIQVPANARASFGLMPCLCSIIHSQKPIQRLLAREEGLLSLIAQGRAVAWLLDCLFQCHLVLSIFHPLPCSSCHWGFNLSIISCDRASLTSLLNWSMMLLFCSAHFLGIFP